MDYANEEEPAKWRAPREVPFKKVSVGLKQLTEHGIVLHLKQLKDRLQALKKSHEAESVLSARDDVRDVLNLLKRDLQELDGMRASVKKEDENKFDNAAEKSRHEILDALVGAKSVIDSYASRVVEQAPSEPAQSYSNSSIPQQDEVTADGQNLQASLLTLENEGLEERARAWESLARDMQDLLETMKLLGIKVDEQGETVSKIEHDVESTVSDVIEGEGFLEEVNKRKKVMLPILGCTVGFAAGGPIGAVVGARIGFFTSVIGGAIGYAGGSIIRSVND